MSNISSQHSNESVSGSLNVTTEDGHVMTIFALSAKDFDKIKPGEEVYREVAAMMVASNRQFVSKNQNKTSSNKERLLGLVKG